MKAKREEISMALKQVTIELYSNGEKVSVIQFCAKGEDNFHNVPLISYKTTIFQKIILKTCFIKF